MKLSKKIVAVLLALVLVFSFAACTAQSDTDTESNSTSDLKIGIILVGDENEGYSAAHINGIKDAMTACGITDDQVIWKYSIPEDETCYDTAVDLAEQGCNYIFSNSYSHQSYMVQAAAEYPDITFCAATGDTAAVCGLSNVKNYFTQVYQSRYVSGVVAGMKLKQLIDEGTITVDQAKVGYVGAYPYAEVVSGYTAFLLGIQSIVPEATMEVRYTNSWFDITAEGEAANALISDGCIIIGQHADSTGAPQAVQAAQDSGKVCYSVGYNIDMLEVAPTAALTSATNVWSVYYTYAFNCALNGEEIKTDWSEGFDTGAVAITALGESCAPGTAEKVAEVEAAIKDGSLKVFDTSKFTVDGETVTTHTFDSTITNTETGETIYAGQQYECIKTDDAGVSYFAESEFRSAPYFDLRIDGITELN